MKPVDMLLTGLHDRPCLLVQGRFGLKIIYGKRFGVQSWVLSTAVLCEKHRQQQRSTEFEENRLRQAQLEIYP